MTRPDETAAASPEATGGDAVVLRRVSKLYGDVAAVDDLSLAVHSGEFLSLLGPSGCGKTTTLRMIAGFEHPDTGDILVDGTSVLGVPPYKRQVNTVFQAYALFPHMSVAENVAYGLEQRRTPKTEIRTKVAEALDMVQMRGYANRPATQLSGGQQQRVALARALVNRPSVLLLDEPLGALDRQLREEMQVELKLLQTRLGISFVFVTHDQGEALSMSDRIAIMREGRVEQLADADTIYSSPASAYVAGFVGQQNFVDGRATGGGGVDTDLGPLRTARASEVADGDRVRVAVRPEFVELTRRRALRDERELGARHGHRRRPPGRDPTVPRRRRPRAHPRRPPAHPGGPGARRRRRGVVPRGAPSTSTCSRTTARTPRRPRPRSRSTRTGRPPAPERNPHHDQSRPAAARPRPLLRRPAHPPRADPPRPLRPRRGRRGRCALGVRGRGERVRRHGGHVGPHLGAALPGGHRGPHRGRPVDVLLGRLRRPGGAQGASRPTRVRRSPPTRSTPTRS